MDILSIIKFISRQFFLIEELKSVANRSESSKLQMETIRLKAEVEWLKKTIIEGKYADKFDEVREKVLTGIEEEVAQAVLNKVKNEIENSESISEELIAKKIEQQISDRINKIDFTKHIADIRKQHTIKEKIQREQEQMAL